MTCLKLANCELLSFFRPFGGYGVVHICYPKKKGSGQKNQPANSTFNLSRQLYVQIIARTVCSSLLPFSALIGTRPFPKSNSSYSESKTGKKGRVLMSDMLWAYARPVPPTAVPLSWVVSFAKIGSVSKGAKATALLQVRLLP